MAQLITADSFPFTAHSKRGLASLLVESSSAYVPFATAQSPLVSLQLLNIFPCTGRCKTGHIILDVVSSELHRKEKALSLI